MQVIDNRRSHSRVSAIFSVDIAGHGGNFAVDIGTGGVRLVSRQPLLEDELELRLHLDSDMQIVLKGRPVWQQRMSLNGKTMAGISFVHGQEEAREQLRSWLESYSMN